MWRQSANRLWAALLIVGGHILTAVVVFQGIVTAPPPVVTQGAERTSEDRGL
jgi:flagellar biosynthesis component FlhA